MTKKTHIPDRTALIPFVLFGIFALIVGYSIYKGTHRPKTVKMEEDVLYVKPTSQI